jgi:hypothetical protein
MLDTRTEDARGNAAETAAIHHSHELAEKFIIFLETGDAPDGLFAPDVFTDLSLPTWRLQSRGVDGVVGLHTAGHPGPSTVKRWRFDPIPTGFVLEFDEAWDQDGEHWTAREFARADVSDEGITELSIYCTGDWSAARRAEHAEAVSLLRP